MTIKRKTHLNLSGSHHTLDSDNAFVGGFAYITGSLTASSGLSGSLVQGTNGLFVNLSASISGTSAGNPFIVAGPNVTANYNSLGQWEITGSAGSTAPAGSDSQVQFNQNGVFAASSSFTHVSGTLGIRTISGSNDTTFLTSFGIAEALLVNSNVAVTQSMIFFDGKDQAIDAGGTMYLNGASIDMYSGSAVGDSDFTIAPNVDGSGGVYVKFDNLINIRPLYVTMSTGNATPTLLSGSLLTGSLINATISKLDFNVIAIEQASDNFASWTFSATIRSNLTDQRTVLAATELDSIFEGANASTWDVNINTNGDIYCTGSAGTVHWYAQATKKMVLSGSGDLIY
jgi:hypothetical protein